MSVSAMLGTLVGLGVASGLNLYATVFATGVAIRFGLIQVSPPLDGLIVLAQSPILVAAGVLYVVEFVADKIPVVEHAWDLLHTFVRPLGAVWLGLTATSSAHMSASTEVLLLLLMGGATFTAHLGKAGTRLASAASGGHVVGVGIALSLAEDLFSLAVAPLAVTHPRAVLVVALAGLSAIVLLVPFGVRYLRGRGGSGARGGNHRGERRERGGI